MKLNKDSLFSPPAIFIYYILASFLAVMGFRLFFPGVPPPLAIYSRSWRLCRGLLDWMSLFPALAMSALVIPFGFLQPRGKRFVSFSPKFLNTLKGPIFTAIGAAVFYGVLCFLVYPVVWDKEADMRFRGRLFAESWARIREYAAAGDWVEASRFLAVNERIWPNSPNLEELRTTISVEMAGYPFGLPEGQPLNASSFSSVPPTSGPQGISTRGSGADVRDAQGPSRREPVDAAEALTQAEAAFQGARYYDAHWLATLAGRLARRGSVETVEAARIASRAWNAITSLAPNSREIQAVRLYRLKNSGYEAMVARDWIRGYYIFKELAVLTPRDPDVINFLNDCEQGLGETAFFIDESEMTLGEILSGAVFSIPRRTPAGTSYGRVVMQVRSLSASPDYSYGIGIELLFFDEKGELENRLESQYAKILPKTLGGQKRVHLLLRALDRENEERRWEPVWASPGRPGLIGYDGGDLDLGDAQVILDIPYEDFLLSTQVRRGVNNFFIGELLNAERTLGDYGYVPQVFAAELLSRFAEPVYFMALLILTLIIGWRYRVVRRPHYLGIPMLFVLPLVFDGVMHIYRAAMNILGIRLILSLSFVPAMIVIFACAFFSFILFLICLACQHD
jgi:hypothetical protein